MDWVTCIPESVYLSFIIHSLSQFCRRAQQNMERWPKKIYKEITSTEKNLRGIYFWKKDDFLTDTFH